MDTVRIGRFLKELRKERGLTQEQLGEKLGVTNKTVSRWETGNYLPPVECLSMLSDLYGFTINELVAGERLDTESFSQAAEENLSMALEENEKRRRSTEKRLLTMMALSTLIAMAVILLIPGGSSFAVRKLLIIVLVVVLASIGNAAELVALLLNKEGSGK
ncbi:MAG: helix-turn-helix transcriptional regulator [Ruminococcus sp.]|nr:helix-turn-helix transcriptional regulator [Ruminococcus sp.]